MSKYLKVMFGNKSACYKIGEVNIAKVWSPNAKSDKKFGGFTFTTEDKIIRWLHKGDTLYDVEIPDGAEVIDVVESATIHGVFRSNKIIIKNPRKVTDEMALEFYKKSTIPEMEYYKVLAAVAVMDYKKTALAIFNDKVDDYNIGEVLLEWNGFIGHGDRKGSNETVRLIEKKLRNLYET